MSKKPKAYKRPCWPHPLLEIKPGLRLVAGSGCAHPIVDDYDVYIGFDVMTLTKRHLPWTPGVEIHYQIADMQAPKNAKTYRKLVDWTLEQMEGGARVHAGCIGGHGRTGMFFVALVAAATGRTDAISYVREHYCKKACETSAQIDFLVKHYSVDPVTASKCGVGGVVGWEKSGTMVFDEDWINNKAIVPLTNPQSSTNIWGSLLGDDDGDGNDV